VPEEDYYELDDGSTEIYYYDEGEPPERHPLTGWRSTVWVLLAVLTVPYTIVLAPIAGVLCFVFPPVGVILFLLAGAPGGLLYKWALKGGPPPREED
jgi:hypothetical protein